MAHIVGALGSIVSGVTEIVGAGTWSIDESADTPETTDYQSDGVKDYIAGNTGWGGSFDLTFDTTQDPFTDPPNLNAGQTLTMKFYVNAAQYMTGDIIVSGVSTNAPQGDLVKLSVTFQGTGALDKSNM